MHIVEIAMRHLVAVSPGMKALDAPLHRGLFEDIVDRRLGVDWEDDAPDAALIVARNLEQRAPFLGVGDVIGQRIAMRLEIIASTEHKKALLVGEARKLHPHRLAHLAAPAIAA